MAEWSTWILFSLLCLFVGARIVAVFWAFLELRRKSVPELWGIDWLDILHRVEREFGVLFSRQDFEAIPKEERVGLTAGRLWALIEAKLRSAGRPVPDAGWEKLVGAIVEGLNVTPDEVRPESRLYADLGMEPDMGC